MKQDGTPDIFDILGPTLNKPVQDRSTGVVYDTLGQSTNTGSVVGGGNATLESVSMATVSKTVGPGADIQHEAEKVAADGGGVLELKPGTYTITKQERIPSNVQIVGAGIGATVLRLVGNVGIAFEGSLKTSAGSVAFTEGSQTITGTGTAFLSAQPGDILLVNDDNFHFWSEIAVVNSATTLTLVKEWPMPSNTGFSFEIFTPNRNGGLASLTIDEGGAATQLMASLSVEYALNFNGDSLRVTNNLSNYGIELNRALACEFTNVESSYHDNHGWKIFAAIGCTFTACDGVGSGGSASGFNIQSSFTSTYRSCRADGNGGHGFFWEGGNQDNMDLLIGCRADGNDDDGFRANANQRPVLVACEAGWNGSDGFQFTGGGFPKLFAPGAYENTGYGLNFAGASGTAWVYAPHFTNNNVAGAGKINGTYDPPESVFTLSGTYTPTLTNVANLTGSTAYLSQYMRVGNTVTVSGVVDVDPTAGATTQLGISLPVASAITSRIQVAGTAFCPNIAGQGASVLGDATNDRAQMEWVAVDVTSQPMYFNFSYQIL